LFTDRRVSVASRNWLVYGLLVPLGIFTALALEVARHQTLALDRAALLWLHAHRTPALDAAMLAVTDAGGDGGLIALTFGAVMGLIGVRRGRAALFVALAVVGVEVVNLLLKAVFARARPHLWMTLVQEHSYSFPSGHASGSIALVLALGVALWNTSWRVPAVVAGLVFAGLVALSRVYLGLHYPSDVVGGVAESVLWVTAVTRYWLLPNRTP
jgi:undecaprenyl-diphosphatase